MEYLTNRSCDLPVVEEAELGGPWGRSKVPE
jgi:hypothetical protein